MLCPSCGQETEKGKFCTNCGALLADEPAASAEPEENKEQEIHHEQAHSGASQKKENDFTATVKKESANFGAFFMRLIKAPSKAKNITDHELVPGVITMVLFSVLIALGTYLVMMQIGSMFMTVNFLDGFILPLLQFLVLFVIVSGLTFAASKLTAQSLTIYDVLAKTGAYTVPYMFIYVLGILLSLINLPFAGTFFFVSLLGPILFIPTLILLEKPAKGYDRIYVLIGLYLVSFILSGLLLQNVVGTFFGGFMDSIFSGF
ncbi:hypothetical protein JUJ52_21950 [Virgibacillus sp. AGTR]|uniref:hypothetical protein n=1 Tax=Virgibacillus sp. AGTR TaxID=2812055 RepID=UPI0019637DB1|nr:hypothetical protein [Virgibacillus sp. AGTR]MCC2252596.1 hypothetical protein [Virgibacillus sp. AGTR]QRZ19635.1 hypothetical protein JUJ52_08245 [Virgibacillus sp. AGTR]